MKEIEEIQNPVIIASINLRSLNGQPKMMCFRSIYDLISYTSKIKADVMNTQYQEISSFGFDSSDAVSAE